jgi:GNAT superfamily N-acetyltransferase
MLLSPIRADEIVLKYDAFQYPLVFNYLDKETYQSFYYEKPVFWYEAISQVPSLYDSFGPIGLVALQKNKFRNYSLHVNVLEICKDRRGQGNGTFIMNEICLLAKRLNYISITLQIRDPKLKSFYKKFGFVLVPAYKDTPPYMLKAVS